MARNRLTLLEIVQDVLNKMNHDSVNSITDTVESTQIAKEARNLYYDLMDRDDWPHLIKLRNLEALGDTDRPNFMRVPDNVTSIEQIRYEVTKTTDTSRNFTDICYLAPHDFMEHLFMRRTENSNVITVSDNGVDYFVINDQAPVYWSTFDDEHIVFDNYDSAVDDTLQDSKSLALVKEIPTWTENDTFVPDMPDQMFSAFTSELAAVAFTYWKQGVSVKDEQRAARSISRLRKNARKTNVQEEKADFGRNRNSFYIRSEDGDRGSIRDSLSS